MLVLIWATLLVAVRSNNTNAVVSPGEKERCENGLCISPEITAEAGLCVVLPCYFAADPGFTLESAAWYKCDRSIQSCTDSDIILHLNNTNPNVQSGSRGRVSLLDLSLKNCSIIINDLNKSDNGSYLVRVNGILKGTTKEYASPRATISVKDLIQKPTVMIPALTEGQQTTLTCTAPGLCSGSEPEITWMWRGAGEKDSHITGNITAFKTEDLTAVTQRHSSTLMFNVSAEHHGTEVTCKVIFKNSITTEETVTLNVTYVKRVENSVNTSVKDGEILNLTCSVKSFPPSLITWNKLSLNNNTGSATLVIPNVAVEYSGQYICTAKHLEKPLTVAHLKKLDIAVYPKILNSSGCIKQSEVLTCVCISEGFPLPTIRWPLLQNHTEYSVLTTVSNHTVNSTTTLTVKHHSSTVECVSSSGNGEVKENLTVNKGEEEEEEEEEEDQLMKFLRNVARLEIIIPFLIGALLSAIICGLMRKCHRKKQRMYGNLAETLEMVTSHEDPLIDAGQAVEDYQSIDQVAAEAGGDVAAGKSDVEYSKINFSLIKRNNYAEARMTKETTETDYAEIKELKKIVEEAEERQDGEEMIGEDEETKGALDEKEGEDVALYSNVNDMSQI